MAKTDEEKVAVRVISENRMGEPVEKYLDAYTGSELNDLKGYNVVEAQDYLNDIKDFQSQLPNGSQSSTSSTGFTSQPSVNTTDNVESFIPHETGNNSAEAWQPNTKNIPNVSNNFRYVDKPTGALAVMSRMPGIVGMGAKAVGAMMGVQNTHATGKAREFLGLEPNYLSNGLKNVLGDPNGFIGDVDIGGKIYGVGLGVQDPKGRTTLTPNEARQRALLSGVQVKDATRQQTKEAQKSFKANKEISPEAVRDEADLGKNIFNGSMASAETSRAVTSAPIGNSSYDLAVGLGMGDLPAREIANVSFVTSQSGHQHTNEDPVIRRGLHS